ncbi:MAG: hypothetical protein EBS29_00305 [Chloroflexia bacterium]|nr:hypothetical protein [Chloroflexia bacterium]
MITLNHLFLQVDRVFRNRGDAPRWRVTQHQAHIEVYRRPLLTSAVTLGAIGIGDAAMPVPQLICTIALSNTTPEHVDIYIVDAHLTPQLHATVLPNQVIAHLLPIITPFA